MPRCTPAHEAMDAAPALVDSEAGWNSVPADYDGTPMVTDIMSDMRH